MTSHMLPKISFLVILNQKDTERVMWSVDVSLARPKFTNTPLNSNAIKKGKRIIRTKKFEMTRKFSSFYFFWGLFFSAYLIQHTTMMMMMIEWRNKATKYNNKIARWLLYYKSTSLYTLFLFFVCLFSSSNFDTFMWHVSVKKCDTYFVYLFFSFTCLNNAWILTFAAHSLRSLFFWP